MSGSRLCVADCIVALKKYSRHLKKKNKKLALADNSIQHINKTNKTTRNYHSTGKHTLDNNSICNTSSLTLSLLPLRALSFVAANWLFQLL